MPRPQRVKLAEEARAQETLQNATVSRETPTATEDVDNTAQAVALSPEGSDVAQGDDVIRQIASRVGWKPKDEWPSDRPPERWQDAPAFIEGTVQANLKLKEQNDQLHDRLRRLGQVADAQAQEARREGYAEAQKRLSEAAKAGDESAAQQAAADMARNLAPDSRVPAWVERNPWFKTDSAARAVAIAEGDRLAKSGATLEEELAGSEAAVRRRFPEYFEEQRTNGQAGEIRLSEVKPAPQMAGGSRTGDTVQTKQKGWGDIPFDGRTQMKRFFIPKMMRRGLTEAQAQTQLAEQYWATQ